ncbi:hypothetical protein [Brevibacterium aurantiacum]|uniref:Uncharacterized protein n=1 Tax=Brevibacterium aurantiacum TaxID=273384 RepID=A0A556C2Z2_BREAU|nr:hypothetical protein [Brevibacterium aurantiacum]TSI11736.1 hypothetical protein FO013_21610 [Brevibacterium aurantiacum]
MSDAFGLAAIRQVLATEARLREVRKAIQVKMPVESEADLTALRQRLEQSPTDTETDHLGALGNEMAVLDRQVLAESLLALGEIGFDSAAVAVAHVLDEVRQSDAATSAV